MIIECYYSRCPHHDCHEEPDDGPFCRQSECRASPEDLKTYALGRKLELQGYNLNELDEENLYNGRSME